jgi:hypothetical protein
MDVKRDIYTGYLDKIIFKWEKMSKNFLVFIDNSGGMNEMGKDFTLRNLCRFIKEFPQMNVDLFSDIDPKFFLWDNCIKEISWDINADVPQIVPSGSASLNELHRYIESIRNETEWHLLILSDGNFKISEIDDFSRKIKKNTKLKIRTVAVGADANENKLKKISTNESIYLAEDIYSAIVSLFFSEDRKIAIPQTIDDLIGGGDE